MQDTILGISKNFKFLNKRSCLMGVEYYREGWGVKEVMEKLERVAVDVIEVLWLVMLSTFL